MRIAFDVAQTAVERAGCAWYADSLARALARHPDIDLDVYPHFGVWLNTDSRHACRPDGARVMLEHSSPEAAAEIWQRAAVEGLPGHPSIVHANSFQAPKVHGTKLVFTIHDLSFWTYPELSSEATRLHCQRGTLDALSRAAGFVFVSKAALTEFESVLPGWLERTQRPSTIVHGASRFASSVSIRSTPDDAPWLCVGSIEPRKNHDALLDAYVAYRSRARRPRPLVLIGGRGWCSEKAHGRILSLSPSEGVVYRGYVSESELRAAYASAFAVIQPSWHEGFGLPVVEAGSLGAPVVCSDIPSLREVGGDAPVYFRPEIPEDLTDLLLRLHNQPSERDRLAWASRQNAERFSWDLSAERLVTFYRTLLAPDGAIAS